MNYIIEVANTHGGSKDYVLSLIEEFAAFEGHGIKFQPFQADKLATPDYTWYQTYQELEFSPYEWQEIISRASLTKKVWLDLFDIYGVQILEENLPLIFGIKLQTSILYNEQVIHALKKVNCKEKKIILNVSALEKEEIKGRLDYIKNNIEFEEILIEVGFQSYPTELEDCGLVKIKYLKSNFPNRIVFADHIDGNSDDAIILPLIASFYGVDYIEKHVMHSSLKTKYDYFSSINFKTYAKLVHKIKSYSELEQKPFITYKEKTYLLNSIQKPIASQNIPKGKGICLISDIEFKRSNQVGLSALELRNLISKGYILARDSQKGQTFKREDFKKAVVAVVIAGRLKSSRLKRKALLPIGNMSSIEKCIQSCLSFPESAYVILATSTLEEDAELEKYTYAPHVLFHKGDPDDVIQRYLDITDRLGIDIIYRVTADMPYVSDKIAGILLNEHLIHGADYTAAREFSIGTSPEVINIQALKEVKRHFPTAEYSEYMTWYFQNNKDYFRVHLVDLPQNLVRNYRLTLDYQEDLILLNHVQKFLDEKKLSNSIENIFEYLDTHPEIAKINAHLKLRYKNDESLIETLNKVTKIIK